MTNLRTTRNAQLTLGWLVWLIIVSFPFSIALNGYFQGQTGVNAVRAQFEAQKEARAEFIRQIQAAGLQVEEGPAVPPATKG